MIICRYQNKTKKKSWCSWLLHFIWQKIFISVFLSIVSHIFLNDSDFLWFKLLLKKNENIKCKKIKQNWMIDYWIRKYNTKQLILIIFLNACIFKNMWQWWSIWLINIKTRRLTEVSYSLIQIQNFWHTFLFTNMNIPIRRLSRCWNLYKDNVVIIFCSRKCEILILCIIWCM